MIHAISRVAMVYYYISMFLWPKGQNQGGVGLSYALLARNKPTYQV